ncbi:MAG: GntR family transcriptional regulator [Solirubrobacterales bacterium]
MSAETKADLAYALIRERVLDESYVAGHRLVITQLVRETGISGIPWREAFRRLETEGWVELERNVGARVATFDAAEYARSGKVLALLGGYATAAALQRLSAVDVGSARAINEAMARAEADHEPDRCAALDREFHFVFHARAGDAHLCRVIATEWDRLDMIRRTCAPRASGRHQEAVDEHAELLELLAGRQPAGEVEDFTRRHFMQMVCDPVYDPAGT